MVTLYFDLHAEAHDCTANTMTMMKHDGAFTRAITRAICQMGSKLITVALLLFAVSSLNTAPLTILLEGREILAGIRELTFLHIPVDEGTLGDNELELMVNERKHLRDGSADNADGPITIAKSSSGTMVGVW